MDCPVTARPTVIVISDSLGDTACEVVLAASGQFDEGAFRLLRLPKVTSVEQVKSFVGPRVDADHRDVAVFHTIVDPALRARVLDYLGMLHIRSVDLIGPTLAVLSSLIGVPPKCVAGVIHKTDDRYFHRIEAMEYFVEHDDGRGCDDLSGADIVLLGVSRTSKTPLSMYLAYQGYKVANVPLAHGMEPPKSIYEVDPMRLFGLISTVDVISEIRDSRLGDDYARAVAGSYAEPESVRSELAEARALMKRLGCFVVRTDGKAIEESLKLLEYQRVSASSAWGTDEIEGTFPELVDQVMGEASLYAPRLAALALKQAQGSPDEAVFLLRAFRSTLERPYVSRPVDTGAMRVNRRVSAAFKDVPGGQVLGATRDYSHRLLAFDLETEGAEELAEKRAELAAHFEKVAEALEAAPDVAPAASPCAEIPVGAGCCPPAGAQQGTPTKSPDTAVPGAPQTPATLPRVLDYLRAQGLLAHVEADDAPPVDATMAPLSFPAPRSVRLQTLARGMTQAVEALGYAAIRGFGPAHPTVGELRSGRVAVAVDHPLEAGDEQDAYYLGSVPVTEVESVFESEGESDADGGTATATRSDGGGLSLAIGYGLVFGRAETKAIAMSVLDHCLERGDKRFPTEDEEFVLYHVDGVEATGFISHLKLPHYVTFQSKLSSVRGTRDEHSECGECDPHGTRVAHDPQSTRDPHDQPAESKEARDAAAL